MGSYRSPDDQRRIAEYYRHEAERFRHQADELEARVALYQRLFGPESDWVAGTRLLIEAYRQSADERERLAQEHGKALEAREAAPER